MDKARVAIGISLLKFKPSHQSYASYVLDIHDKFLLSTASASVDENSWRTLALSLERSLEELQTKYESDHIQLLALGASVGDPKKHPVCASIEVQPSKKKVKKKATQLSVTLDAGLSRIDLDMVLGGFGERYDALTALSRGSIFACFDTLSQLLMVIGESKVVTMDLLVSRSNRALEGMGILLRSVLPPHLVQPSWSDLLLTVTSLSSYILTSVLPHLSTNPKGKRKIAEEGSMQSGVALDQFLRTLATSICIPLIQAFIPLSKLWASSVFPTDRNTKRQLPGPGSKANAVDVRQDIRYLLRKTMLTLDDFTFVTNSGFMGDLKQRLALEALREVEQLHLTAGRSHDPHYLEHSSRVTYLAAKDAFWYLSDTLLLLITPRMHQGTFEPTWRPYVDGRNSSFVKNGLVQDRILLSLSRLIQRSENASPNGFIALGGWSDASGPGHTNFGRVGQNILLTIVEKVGIF